MSIKTAEEYYELTRGGTGVVVVRCTAEWCSACKLIAEEYAGLSMPGVNFYTIDVDSVEDFAEASYAKKLPCFFVFKDGVPNGLIVGANISALITSVKKLQ